MLRWLPLVLLAACQPNDKPTLVLSSDGKTLAISLARGDDHSFGHVTATANGIDLGAPELAPGSEGIAWSQASSPATATFQVAIADLGAGADVIVHEDDDRFEVVAPDLGAPRAAKLLTAIDTPITPGTWLDATDGVASDVVSGGFELDVGSDSCTVQWGTRLSPGEVSLQLGDASELQTDWWCGDYPAAGTVVQAQLSMDLWVAAKVTSCRGDDLTCPDIALPDLHVATPVRVQF